MIANPFANVGAGYAFSNMLAASLTYHQDMVDANSSFGTPQLEQTAVRVVGDIHIGMNAFATAALPTVALMLDIHLRIAVAQQVPDSFYGIDADQLAYNMDEPWVANDDFLWHHHVMTVLRNSFWSGDVDNPGDLRIPMRIPVDVRVQRRLKQRNVLALFFQATQKGLVDNAGVITYTTWPDLRIWCQPCLRTLVRTIT